MTINERIALARKACERYHCLGDPSKWDDADNFTAILDSHERLEKALRRVMVISGVPSDDGEVPKYLRMEMVAMDALAALDVDPKENPDA